MNVNGSMSNATSLYGIWQNGVGSTSYTLAGGTNNGIGINQGMLVNYDSSTGVFSNLTTFSANNAPGVITHFEGITAVPGGFNLYATTDSTPGFAFVPVNADGSFGTATWTLVSLPGSTTMTGNSVYQNSVMGVCHRQRHRRRDLHRCRRSIPCRFDRRPDHAGEFAGLRLFHHGGGKRRHAHHGVDDGRQRAGRLDRQ